MLSSTAKLHNNTNLRRPSSPFCVRFFAWCRAVFYCDCALKLLRRGFLQRMRSAQFLLTGSQHLSVYSTSNADLLNRSMAPSALQHQHRCHFKQSNRRSAKRTTYTSSTVWSHNPPTTSLTLNGSPCFEYTTYYSHLCETNISCIVQRLVITSWWVLNWDF